MKKRWRGTWKASTSVEKFRHSQRRCDGGTCEKSALLTPVSQFPGPPIHESTGRTDWLTSCHKLSTQILICVIVNSVKLSIKLLIYGCRKSKTITLLSWCSKTLFMMVMTAPLIAFPLPNRWIARWSGIGDRGSGAPSIKAATPNNRALRALTAGSVILKGFLIKFYMFRGRKRRRRGPLAFLIEMC